MKEEELSIESGIRKDLKPDNRIEIYDDVVPGMILRITPTGHKSFAFRYWYDGTSKQRTIGKYGQYTLAGARKKAREWKDMVSDGLDPIHEKRKNKEQVRVTLSDYIERFKVDYLKRKLKQSTQNTYTARLNKVKDSRIGDTPIETVTRADVRSFLKGEAKSHPTNANRLHSILSKVFNEALEDGLIEENPIKGMPKMFDESRRETDYSNDDIQSIWKAIEQEREPVQSLLKVLLITGQRLGETSRMKWNDISDGVWTIPISEQKTGKKTMKPHTVPLSGMAQSVLRKMQSLKASETYVFPSPRKDDKPLSHFKAVIDRIRSRTGINEFVIHDLRHIVATGMIDQKIDFIHVGKVLNHKGLSANNVITSRYIQHDYTEEKRQAMDIWSGHLTGLVSPLSKVETA